MDPCERGLRLPMIELIKHTYWFCINFSGIVTTDVDKATYTNLISFKMPLFYCAAPEPVRPKRSWYTHSESMI